MAGRRIRPPAPPRPGDCEGSSGRSQRCPRRQSVMVCTGGSGRRCGAWNGRRRALGEHGLVDAGRRRSGAMAGPGFVKRCPSAASPLLSAFRLTQHDVSKPLCERRLANDVRGTAGDSGAPRLPRPCRMWRLRGRATATIRVESGRERMASQGRVTPLPVVAGVFVRFRGHPPRCRAGLAPQVGQQSGQALVIHERPLADRAGIRVDLLGERGELGDGARTNADSCGFKSRCHQRYETVRHRNGLVAINLYASWSNPPHITAIVKDDQQENSPRSNAAPLPMGSSAAEIGAS